ncbi:major facilitator superfamily domain-containing protein [Aspergillus ambiguus]|uniref:major facilitator superfamily domain-containing protein n=1 Tax=Aspergillus ambiguus TaxID=176160 RepID=UPI003CCCC738
MENTKDEVPEVSHLSDVEMTFEKNGDIGARFLEEHDVEFTEEESRRLRWKIDWRIVPLAAWACGLQFVDKSGLGAAATYGLREDIHLVGQEYSWCVSFFFMPDSPLSAPWLNDREKAIAVKRVAKDQLGMKNTHFKWDQVNETLRDPKAWLLVLQMFFSQTAGSVTTNFLGIVISGFGYTALKAQLFTAPNYAVQAVMQVIVSGLPTFFSCFRNMKQPLAAISSVVAVVGIALLYVTPAEDQHQHRRLASCIIISFSGVNYTVVMSVIGTNIAGFTRKQVVTSTAFFLYCIANIITPQTFMGRESPRYHTGLAFVLACLSCYIALSTITWLMMRFENKHRDKLARHNADFESSALRENSLSGLQWVEVLRAVYVESLTIQF